MHLFVGSYPAKALPHLQILIVKYGFRYLLPLFQAITLSLTAQSREDNHNTCIGIMGNRLPRKKTHVDSCRPDRVDGWHLLALLIFRLLLSTSVGRDICLAALVVKVGHVIT